MNGSHRSDISRLAMLICRASSQACAAKEYPFNAALHKRKQILLRPSRSVRLLAVMIPSALASCAMFVLTLASAAPALVALPKGPPGPGVRNAHGLGFDGRQVVLFGGADERAVRSDTWGWDGRGWTLLATLGPPGRTFPAMASGEGAVYLFGGNSVLFGDSTPSLLLSDLWRWRGNGWERIEVSGPSARAESAMAWDPLRRRLVLFGGYRYGSEGRIEALGDTWEYFGAKWTRHDGPGPGPRHGAVAAFDAAGKEVILFGGNGGKADTWAWNGARWRRVDHGPTPGRYNAVASPTGQTGPVLRFGGWFDGERHADTLVWRHQSWRPIGNVALPDSPSPRNHSAVAYDQKRARVVMVGGHDGEQVFGDVWEWSQNRWRKVFSTPTIRRVENGH